MIAIRCMKRIPVEILSNLLDKSSVDNRQSKPHGGRSSLTPSDCTCGRFIAHKERFPTLFAIHHPIGRCGISGFFGRSTPASGAAGGFSIDGTFRRLVRNSHVCDHAETIRLWSDLLVEKAQMTGVLEDIYSEQPDIDVDTLSNLGPLRAIAGVWEGSKSLDVNPFRNGDRRQRYVERIELQPIDPQSNGPQLLYGLRYHTHIVKPGQVETYHDQVGYWLWEPATGLIMHSLTIPRGQVVLAFGYAAEEATTFEVVANRGATENGICSTPFLEKAFRTDSFTIKVTVNPDDTWSYFEDTVLTIPGRNEPFHHTDKNTLSRIAPPRQNPLAAAARNKS